MSPVRLGDNYQVTFLRRDRIEIKRKLLGLCCREAIKTRGEIIDLFDSLSSFQGDLAMPDIARETLAKGYLPYLDGKILTFIRLVDEDNVERYRIRLENPAEGWEVH